MLGYLALVLTQRGMEAIPPEIQQELSCKVLPVRLGRKDQLVPEGLAGLLTMIRKSGPSRLVGMFRQESRYRYSHVCIQQSQRQTTPYFIQSSPESKRPE